MSSMLWDAYSAVLYKFGHKKVPQKDLLKLTSHREYTYRVWQCNLRKQLTRFGTEHLMRGKRDVEVSDCYSELAF